MNNPVTFKISPNAIFETFGDEVMVINMVSGTYFALDQTALGIWTQLQNHQPLNRIIETTQQQYQGDPDTIEGAVHDFVSELEREDLLVRLEGVESDGTSAAPIESGAGEGMRPPFQAPVLSKFTDMQDLLMLDPIHEVDEMGWPHAKAAPADGEGQ